MEAEFISKFSSYSNFELLKITYKPDNYQANAVLAAEKILQERTISEADLSAVEDFYSEIETKVKDKTQEIEDIDEKIFDFLYPTEIQSKTKELIILFCAFLSIPLIEYCYKSYYFLQYFFHLLKFNSTYFDFFFIDSLLQFFYFPFLLYLIYKKKKLGWILLYLKNTFNLFLLTKMAFPVFFNFGPNVQITSPIIMSLSLFYYITFNIYLFIPNISNLFGIGSYFKRRIVLLTITFILIYITVSST